MIVEKLIAKNFKKHRSINLNFTVGKNLITGNNYSGKSTILQALLVGLYGNAMAPGETKDLIHDDAKDFSIELWLDNGVCIKRSAKNSSIIDPSGSVVVRTHTAVNKWCEEMLETDRKTFLRVFASEQGSPQALLAMEGAQLRNFIEQAIGLGELDKLTKKSNAEITSSAAGYNANEELVLPGDTASAYYKKCKEYTGIEKESQAGVLLAEESIARLSKVVEDLDTEYHLQKAAKSKLAGYLQSVGTYEKMLSELPAHRPFVSTGDLVAKLDRDTGDYFSLQDQEKAYKSACKNFDECEDYLNSKVKGLDESLPEGTTSTHELSDLNEATEVVTELGRQAKELETSLETSACPTCKRPFENAANVEEIAERLVAKRELVDEAVAIRVGCLEKYDKASAAEQIYDKALVSLERARGVIEGLEDQLAWAAEKKKHATVNLPVAYTNGTLKSSLATLADKVKEMAEQNRASKSVEEKRDSLVKMLAELEEPKLRTFDLEGISKELGLANTQLVTHRQNLTNDKVCLAESRAKRESLLSLLQKNEKVKDRMVQFKEAHSAYSAISVALKGAREKAVESAFAQTMGIASEFVKACTGGDISEVYLTEAGIRYTENGRGRGTVSASGAQKTLIGLGMKLGLSHIVRSPFGSLLLDEISADMDADVSTACLTVLGEYCEQAIIVSHTASDVADNVISL